MSLLEDLQFELERRVILFKSGTTMPDATQLGFNGDPNTIVAPSTPGETLLFNCPIGTRYQEDNGKQWYKAGINNLWEEFGGGSAIANLINDGITALTSTWSSEKIQFELDAIGQALNFRGIITEPADFPDPLDVQPGWLYLVRDDVTDNDPTKTNTGVSFTNGDEIAWNGTKWVLLGSTLLWVELVDRYRLANDKPIDLQTSGLLDEHVTTPIRLGDIDNTELETVNKTLVGSINELFNRPSVNGGVFITDITAQNSIDNVGGKQFSSDGRVLDACVTDTEELTIHVLAITGNTNFRPVVEIDGVPVPLTIGGDEPLFTGTLNVSIGTNTEITVIHEDGASHTVNITQQDKPVINSVVFTGGYPGSQTELKEDDEYSIEIQTDTDVVEVQIDNYGAFKTESFPVSGQTFTVDGTIADRGNTLTVQGARVRVRNSVGSWSSWYLTENDGSVDGTNVVNLNNLRPTIIIGSIVYPVTQQALKGSESATVNNTVTNFDSIVYSNPLNELTIGNTSTYEPSKEVTRANGSYNITNNNFTITAFRNANASQVSNSTVVFIANVLPIITINTPAAHLRSGGNNGTAPQDHIITLTSNQNLISVDLDEDEGTFIGSWAGGPTVWTRTLRVHDNDQKGSYNFNSLNAISLSGMIQSTIASGETYSLRGFVSRTVSLAAFANEVNIGVAATTYNNVTLSWSFKPSLVNREPINSTPPIVNGWCLVTLDTNPTTIRILDTAATSSSSQASNVTIQETI